MEAEKSIKIEDEDNGYEEEMFHQTHPFEIKIEEGDLASLSPKGVCENENVESAIPNGRCENENLNELDTIKVEYDYGFLKNEENFLLEFNSLDTDYESKRNYVDPRITPCVVLIERCEIPQNEYKCKICNECFTEQIHLLRHKDTVRHFLELRKHRLSTHRKLRPFKCKKCGKTFSPLKCDLCGQIFPLRDSFLEHLWDVHDICSSDMIDPDTDHSDS